MSLDGNRNIISGSTEQLVECINRCSDLKIGTKFRHDEHMDISSPIKDCVHEISEFHQTIIIDNDWCAGFMTLRQPADIPYGFGPRASLSLFMYNQNGMQAVARPFLDGQKPTGFKGLCIPTQYTEHTKMKYFDCFDNGTNAPSMNFVYEFDRFDFLVKDTYQEVLSHDENGCIRSGSFHQLNEAYKTGADLKVGITGICNDLMHTTYMKNEIFVHLSYCYLYAESGLFLAETQPFVRVSPEKPLVYKTDNWDYCWAIPHTNGKVNLLVMNPYTLEFTKTEHKLPVRWFAAI